MRDEMATKFGFLDSCRGEEIERHVTAVERKILEIAKQLNHIATAFKLLDFRISGESKRITRLHAKIEGQEMEDEA